MASIHQAGALTLFWLAIFFLHRLRAYDHTKSETLARMKNI
jgi:hypothetical protein